MALPGHRARAALALGSASPGARRTATKATGACAFLSWGLEGFSMRITWKELQEDQKGVLLHGVPLVTHTSVYSK